MLDLNETSPEILIVGAGPAGLTAAVYLARFRRRVWVIDSGASRASWIPASRNLIGFRKESAGTTYWADCGSKRASIGLSSWPVR
jgi:thioredoxin reductase